MKLRSSHWALRMMMSEAARMTVAGSRRPTLRMIRPTPMVAMTPKYR